ncbi:hypothetical protein [Bacillus sp. RAR_GA_16]|uniref:hypothetical protein n=1 Tax=Bacillus sp. RAR_GA_16 TaxID=2876774 RepID=UPI001CCA2122|nr:hypothetical protein [Bacillus sp. RAR_GA_16]MCA0171901.1 hypothetical protein [Bacillus sp. RAR_GA_16]
MKGWLIVIGLLCVWVGAGFYKDYQREILPFEIMGENTSVQSGYNDIHVFRENKQITKLEVYDQTGERIKIYHLENLKELYPSATYVNGEVRDGKLYLMYEVEGEIDSKRVVVGNKGSLSFMPVRK